MVLNEPFVSINIETAQKLAAMNLPDRIYAALFTLALYIDHQNVVCNSDGSAKTLFGVAELLRLSVPDAKEVMDELVRLGVVAVSYPDGAEVYTISRDYAVYGDPEELAEFDVMMAAQMEVLATSPE